MHTLRHVPECWNRNDHRLGGHKWERTELEARRGIDESNHAQSDVEFLLVKRLHSLRIDILASAPKCVSMKGNEKEHEKLTSD